MEQSLGKLRIGIFGGAGGAHRSGKCIVVNVAELIRNDVHTKLLLFNVGHRKLDSDAQERRKFLEHGGESSRMKAVLNQGALEVGEFRRVWKSPLVATDFGDAMRVPGFRASGNRSDRPPRRG
jgi:hypothetical protein